MGRVEKANSMAYLEEDTKDKPESFTPPCLDRTEEHQINIIFSREENQSQRLCLLG